MAGRLMADYLDTAIFENALVGTVVIPPGMTKEVRPLQLEKACSPMEVTLFGRVRLVRLWQ